MDYNSQQIKDSVARILSRDSHSTLLTAAKRADTARLAASSPCEDRFNHAQQLSIWGHDWITAAVFDGHKGWQMADHLEQVLIYAVQDKLNLLEPALRTDAMVQSTIEAAFTDVDKACIEDYMVCGSDDTLALPEKIRRMQIVNSGSCALLTLYDTASRTLYTACTGDCRGVLGRQLPTGEWQMTKLSDDHSVYNDAEMARLKEAAPDKTAPVENGSHVMGLEVTRAFGNFDLKGDYDTQTVLAPKFATGHTSNKSWLLSPPFLIARPVVTVEKLHAGAAFVILASDGLWNLCSRAETVDLVAQWLEAQPEATLHEMRMDKVLQKTPDSVWWKKEPVKPVVVPPGFDFECRWEDYDTRFLTERTTVEELHNVAVHVLRNACGGSHLPLLSGHLAFEPPCAREVRDDITVQVVFL